MKKEMKTLRSPKFWAVVGTLAAVISVLPLVYGYMKPIVNECSLKINARKGKVEAQYELGNQYFKKGDGEKGLVWCLKAAEQGYPPAMADIATHYYNNKDYSKALEWSRKSAKFGNSHALYLIGMIYMNGSEEIKRDPQKAVQYFQAAKDGGHADATVQLGTCYQQGIGVPQDATMASSLFQQASLLEQK